MSRDAMQVREDASRYGAGGGAQTVPRGYKRTEVGVIPSHWMVVPIPEVLTNIIDYRGRTPRKLGMEWGGDIPALSARNVRMGRIDFEQETNYGSEKLYQRWMTSGDAKRGDIVFTMEAPLGNVAIIPDDRRYILSQRTILIQPDPSLIDSEFLFFSLRSAAFQQQVHENATGSTATGIQRSKFEKLCIALPRTGEQRAIAEVLSDLDGLLSALKALIAKKRAIKQAAMQQLLTGKTRLPGFSEEWEAKRLADDVTLLSGHHVLAHYCNTRGFGTPYLTGPADFPDGRIRQSKFAVKPTTLCKSGDILVTVKGSGAGTLIEADGEYCISRQLMAIRTSRWNPKFTFYSLCQNASSIAAASTGLIPGLSRSDILEQELPVPLDRSEQDAIATVLADMDAEIAALEARRDKTRAIKQGMMQQLLTGRVRLVKPEAAA